MRLNLRLFTFQFQKNHFNPPSEIWRAISHRSLMKSYQAEVKKALTKLGVTGRIPSAHLGGKQLFSSTGKKLEITSPADSMKLGSLRLAGIIEYEKVLASSSKAFGIWSDMPAPQRGEIVRQIGQELRKYKKELGTLVAAEMGKIYQEGLGEVQEMIDICDFAVGLSRQLYGLTMHSERLHHRMYEQWHPLGNVGIISAFNFPVAVWAWNSMLAAVCGNTTIWKPSEKTPLTAVACMNIVQKVMKKNKLPDGIFCMIVGDAKIGKMMAEDSRIPLISATGSTRMGKSVAKDVAGRLGKSILELGGNNAVIVSKNADLKLAIPATIFGCVGTAGQRCTTTRRLIIHEDVYDEVVDIMKTAYKGIVERIGNPLDPDTLVGPLIDNDAVKGMRTALKQIRAEGGKVLFGGQVLKGKEYDKGNYVIPALVQAENSYSTVQAETFAPIVYLIKYRTMEEAVRFNNDVPQGLSSAVFTDSMKESEYFLSHLGSDCGIANVNIGTSGAEIGGAFGGEKETGGGRESGSDAWRAYMRRQTNTMNWSDELPLAQGIEFNI